jgi:hypothetical protein
MSLKHENSTTLRTRRDSEGWGGEIVGIVFILLPQCFAIRSSLHSSRLNQVHFTFISVYPVPGFLKHGVA